MKKVMYYMAVFSLVLFVMPLSGCSSDDEIVKPDEEEVVEDVVEGPSAEDALTAPEDISFLGDSIMYMRSYSLSEYAIKEVAVSTTQNGHITVMGGYKDQSAVYVYAKVDDDKDDLGEEQVKSILEKYYLVDSYVNSDAIVTDIKEKEGVVHDSDFRILRISVQIFTPQNVSTSLNVARGSIIVKDIHGNQHTATSVSGTIKYIDSSGKSISVNTENGYIGLINTSASQAIKARLAKGNIQIVLPKETKAGLLLESSTKVNAYLLNHSNFSGINTRTKVEGVLNGGGYKIEANSGLGVINMRWYEKGEN